MNRIDAGGSTSTILVEIVAFFLDMTREETSAIDR